MNETKKRKDITITSKICSADIDAIIKLHVEYYSKNYGYDDTFESYVASPLEDFASRSDLDERIWIVKVVGEVKGCIAMVRKDEVTAQLRWFILDESLQGMGIGKKLIANAIEFAKEKSYNKIILWTEDELEQAIRLYKKFGFVWKKDVVHEIWGRNLTEQLYEKIL